MAAISIVVPVYNAEKYLDECIISLVGQTFKDIEIVLVDDCSKDGSARICEDWLARDRRIKFISNRVNLGAGGTRNLGLRHASGDYISFMDADDITDPETYETAYRLMTENDLDLLRWSYNTFTIPGHYDRTDSDTTLKICHTPEQLREVALGAIAGKVSGDGEDYDLGCGPWFLAKRQVAMKIRYADERNMICEDKFPALQMALAAKRIGYIPATFYHYRMVETSITHTPSLHLKERVEAFIAAYTPVLRQAGLYGRGRMRMMTLVLDMVIGMAKPVVLSPSLSKSEKREWLENMSEISLLQDLKDDYPVNEAPLLRRMAAKAVLDSKPSRLMTMIRVQNRIQKLKEKIKR